METNAKKVLAALPDWDDFSKLAGEIKKLYVYRMKLENEIRALESENFKTVMSNSKYFVNGKAVSVSYYENAYKHTGLENNLLNLRGELSEVVALLEMNRSQFEIYRMMQELHKTLTYQEKNMV